MTTPLHLKYRPQTLDQVIGQDEVVRTLNNVLKRKSSRAFLFASTTAGVGKTTLARIVVNELGVEEQGVLEIDGATYTSIDHMRQVQEIIRYRAFGDSGGRAIIVDEAHRISVQAWDSVLKAVEEPPAHVTWLFCTTNVQKVPDTIRSRCTQFTLKPIELKELGELYESVCEAEAISLPGDVGDLIIRKAEGSARQMLVYLEMCRGAKTRKEAARIVETVENSDAALELCRLVVQGGTWMRAMGIMEKLEEEDPEALRINIVHYIGKALRGARKDDEACGLLNLLAHFSMPYNRTEGHAPLLLSLGRVLFNDE